MPCSVEPLNGLEALSVQCARRSSQSGVPSATECTPSLMTTVAEQAAIVKALKSTGKGNKDPEVVAAVKILSECLPLAREHQAVS